MDTHLTAAQIDEITAELDRQLRKLTPQHAHDHARNEARAARPDFRRSPVAHRQPADAGPDEGLQEREQAKLGQITEALKRLEAGTFGVCVDCGRPIAFERLLIFPEAPNCAACVGR